MTNISTSEHLARPTLKLPAVAPCFIGGEHVLPGGREVDVIDPYTGSPMGRVAESDSAIVDSAVRAAHVAFGSWSRRPLQERVDIVLAAADAVERAGEELAEIVTREMGMPISLSRVTQWHLPATLLRTAAAQALEIPWVQSIPGATLHRRPSGVVAAISPWNMPLYQIMAKIANAIVAGCTVVIKPSVQTPYDALRLAEIMHEGGIPVGVVNVIQGAGSRTGSELSRHPLVSHVSFTGSVEAGRSVATDAATTLARCTLELGGKSPAVILPSADLNQAVRNVLHSGFVNSGQACNATTRILVPRSQSGTAEDVIRDAVTSFRLGNPALESTNYGPMSSAGHACEVLAAIDRAIKDGGRVITGGNEAAVDGSGGIFIEPTVIADLEEDAHAVQEEIFGPVLVLQTYTDVDDAVRVASNSQFGLSSEVWGDADEAQSVARQLHVGQVKINGVRTRERPTVPFGGVKNSGYGRELGTIGLEEFTDVTAVMA